jgi:hypothetical protein
VFCAKVVGVAHCCQSAEIVAAESVEMFGVAAQ